MKAVVAAFNQEKALVGAFSVITNLRMELFGALIDIHSFIVDSLTPVLPGPHAVEVSLGLEIYFVVEGDHDEDGQPEGEAGGHDGVGVVHDEPALLGVVVLVLDVLMGCVPSLYCYITCGIVAVSSDCRRAAISAYI